ncbi:hypothetical protein [Gordonia otitidis]|nr:hypothetical protein [Gordonia otitidis]
MVPEVEDATISTFGASLVDPDSHMTVISTYHDVVNHAASQALFSVDDIDADGVSFWLEAAYDGEGLFDGLVFDAWIMMRSTSGAEHLRFTTSPESLRVDASDDTEHASFTDLLVEFVHYGVALVNTQIRSDQRAWMTVLGAA